VSIGLSRRPLTLALIIALTGLLLSLAAPAVMPTGGTVSAATPFPCNGTRFFASAPIGTEFREGDTWQGGTFTEIENDHFMRVVQDGGDIVGRFPPGGTFGDRATISFASTIHITAILWRDNDPKTGEAGWSFNGIPGPLTGDDNSIVTPVDITTDTVIIDAGGDSGGIDFCFTTPIVDGGGEGCTPGYWKVAQHHDSWTATGYSTGQTLESVFDVPDSLGMDNRTLLQALGGGGGPGVTGGAKILLRAAVASLLNAAHPDVDFDQSAAEVISSVNTALATLNRNTMLALATSLDEANNEGCPLS
jgi:hypothetical protein